MDSVTDEGLHCGAELVVHAYPRDGRAPGQARVERLGLPSVVCAAGGTSEDVALLMADAKGASLIVAVGTHNTLDEFLDKGRAGYASTWLTRLRVGSKLVDAKGVSRLYRQRISGWALMLLVLAAGITILVVMLASPGGPDLLHVPRRPVGRREVLAQRIVLGQHPMIDFRYHLVSIVAVFLALAIGIVVGSTALKPAVLTGLQKTATAEKKRIDALFAKNAQLNKPAQGGRVLRAVGRAPGCWAACWTGSAWSWSPRRASRAGWSRGSRRRSTVAGRDRERPGAAAEPVLRRRAPSRTWTR